MGFAAAPSPRKLLSITPFVFALVCGGTATAQEPAAAEGAPAPAPAASRPVTEAEAQAALVPPPAPEPEGPTEYRFEFSLFGGGHFFDNEHGLGRSTTDSPDLSPANAPTFGGRLALNFNRWVSVEGEAHAIPTHTISNATDMWVFGYRGSLVVHLMDSRIFRPFLTAGFGALTSVVNDKTQAKSDTDGLVHGGLGFKLGFGDHVGLRAEGRILAPLAFASDVIPVGDELGYHGPDYQILAGLYLNFGEVERQMVYKREVVMVPTVPDPDGDGIVGANDKCPNVAEDKDGFEDEDGCPDNDNDNDGIPDHQDRCPLQPETKNGIDDEDGCPEEDTDGDGIIGSRDRCPDEPETKNNYRDDDGCPDEVPVAVKRFIGVIEGINFKTGSAQIMPGSYAVLDRAVAVLKEHSDVRLEISGHTDNRGSASYNKDLSQRRADAVKNYFIANGIDGGRLTSMGYGFDRPIGDNTSESGRARNRRTEFRLISPEEAAAGSGTSGPPPATPAP